MRLATRLAVASLPLACLLASTRAHAVEVAVAKKPLLIDVTNTAILNYHFNNRNTDLRNGYEGTLLDDYYGEWLDRFNVELSYWRFRLGFRIDGATYAGTANKQGVENLVTEWAKPGELNAYRTQILHELHTRYRTTFYPSKLFVGYIQPGIEITVGDFYAQLGRGLVFSARKIDELAVDTTVRGVKVQAERQFGSFHLGGTLFVGQMNPLRVDETSGRRLNGEGSPLFFGFPRASDLATVGADKVGGSYVPIHAIERGAPNYLEDTVLGARIEGGPKFMTVAVNASVLARRSHTTDLHRCPSTSDEVKDDVSKVSGICYATYPDFTGSTDPAKQHNTIVTWSGSLEFPSIAKHGDVYLEVAGQQLRDGHLNYDSTRPDAPPTASANLSGYAIYLSGSVTGGPVAFSLEGKHYRSFFPLSGNIDAARPGFRAPEFNLITYSQPPTAEPIYVEAVAGAAPNVCVTGGRARVDYRFNRAAAAYTWIGRYSSWSETHSENTTCETKASLRTDTWDAAVGTELTFEKGRSYIRAWIGARDDTLAEKPLERDSSAVFYREGYLRYDIAKRIVGPLSFQMQGVHRRRYEPPPNQASAKPPWHEGENYIAFQWSPHFSAIFGHEYVIKAAGTDDSCSASVPAGRTRPAQRQKNVCSFVNGGLQWRSHGKGGAAGMILDTVAVFVGQRRPALRCVSGVCRQFPPFEGAKLELTSRF